jgi:Gpi18-like mannosyltransferase
VYSIFPVSFQNLDLFGEPLITVFNLETNERHVYSRNLDQTVLTFQLVDARHVVDEQTGSLWSLKHGNAIGGEYAGSQLQTATYSVDAIFPYLGMEPANSPLLSLWQRFDTNWYLKIATAGYSNDGSTVYFPLYPFLIKLLSYLMDPLLAGILISNLALIGVLGMLYRLTARIADHSTARRTVIYLLVFPTAFFLFSAYTESLFMFFVLASLEAACQGKWNGSVVWSFLAALTRLQGVLIVIPLAFLLWRELKETSLRHMVLRGAVLTVVPLATISFMVFTDLSLISTYQGKLQARFVWPWENIGAAFSLLKDGNGSLIDILNLAFTFGLIGITIFIWKKLPFEYFLYSLLMFVAPLFRMTISQPLVSMGRYALVVFPIFIVLGLWGRNQWVNRAILYTSILLQMYLSAQFILWGWVG